MRRKRLICLRCVLILLVLVLSLGMPFIPAGTVRGQTGGTTILYGTSVSGTIAAPDTVVTYNFTGAADDLVLVDIVPLNNTLTPSVVLTGPGGEPLAASQHDRLVAHTRNAHIAQFLPQAGTYTLAVSGTNGTTGDYFVRLLGRGPVASTSLEYGVPVDVTIPQNATSQYFTFTAGDCATTLTVTNQSQGEPFTFPFTVKLRNEQGREIALLLGGDARDDRVTVAALSGRYEIEVLSDDPLVSGVITLLVTCAESAPGCAEAGSAAAGVSVTCPPCPSCPGAFDDGTLPACPVMDFRTVPMPGLGVVLRWVSVPAADYYYIHMYGYRGGDEIYLGAVVGLSEATEFIFDSLPDGFDAFSFVIEAIQDDVVICTDETHIWLASRGDRCDNFGVTGRVDSHADRTVTWTWSAYPGTETYFTSTVFILPDGTEILLGDSWYEPETTTITATYPLDLAPGDVWRLQVSAMIGGDAICFASDTIVFEREGPGQVEWPPCQDFAVSILEHVGTHAAIQWTEYPGAEQYWLYVLDASGMMVSGYPLFLPPSQLGIAIDVGPGTYTVGVSPWLPPEGAICLAGLALTLEDQVPCMVNTERADVRVHVGPGRNRSVFTYLSPGVDYVVTGRAYDADGNLWWQIDKTQVPGHEAVTSLWVAESDVNELGDCDQVPEEEVPPIVPGGDLPPGQWGPCGSCDTCGHPGECVTAPDGQCLWDPATCAAIDQPPPEEGGGDEGGQQPICVTVIASVEPAGTGSAGPITQGNCISEVAGIYTPGSSVQVQASPNGGCWLDHWAGCGASGSANPVTITVNSNCLITAYMQCIQ